MSSKFLFGRNNSLSSRQIINRCNIEILLLPRRLLLKMNLCFSLVLKVNTPFSLKANDETMSEWERKNKHKLCKRNDGEGNKRAKADLSVLAWSNKCKCWYCEWLELAITTFVFPGGVESSINTARRRGLSDVSCKKNTFADSVPWIIHLTSARTSLERTCFVT